MTLWSYVGPPAGAATISVSATGVIGAWAISLYNIVSVQANAGSVNVFTYTNTITGLTGGNLAVDFAFGQANPTSSDSMTAGSGQTVRLNQESAVACEGNIIGISTTTGTSTSWTGAWTPNFGLMGLQGVSLFAIEAGGGGSAPGVGGGGGGMFVPGFDATCALGVGDWLLSTTQPGSKTVTLDDTRPEAALAILYLVNWGDGEFSRATSTPINHTYEEGKLYNVTVRVQYRNNVIEYFVTFVDVRGNNCALQKFSREIMPILWALGALSIVSAAIVTGARYRIAPNKRRALRRILLTVGIVALGSAMAIVVYAYLAGIPI